MPGVRKEQFPLFGLPRRAVIGRVQEAVVEEELDEVDQAGVFPALEHRLRNSRPRGQSQTGIDSGGLRAAQSGGHRGVLPRKLLLPSL